MRIAWLANAGNGNGFYRAVVPMSMLEYGGHRVLKLTTLEPRARLAAVREVDVLHVHRFCDKQHTQPLVREAKAHGAAIVWDDDDDMGSVPKSNPLYKQRGGLHWERRLADMKAVLRMADVATAPNAHLAERLREYGAQHTEVLGNYIPSFFLGASPSQSRLGVTIGWVAGKEHQLDVEALAIRDVLQRILDERPYVHVVSIGLGLGLRGDRYHQEGKVPVMELARHTSTFEIGIAPLADNRFNRSKSNVKLKEYAAAGTPWLASPVGPYLGMGEREGGRLVADDRWYEELARLIDKPRDHAKLAKRALKWAAGQTAGDHVHLWEATFSDAIARAQQGDGLTRGADLLRASR